MMSTPLKQKESPAACRVLPLKNLCNLERGKGTGEMERGKGTGEMERGKGTGEIKSFSQVFNRKFIKNSPGESIFSYENIFQRTLSVSYEFKST